MRFNVIPLAAAVACAIYATPSHADTAPDSTSEQEVERITVTGKYTVNETIDTATGLGLTLRETPQSVTVITAERIQDQGMDSVVDAVANATGISIKEVDNVRNEFKARGFDVNNYQVDGIPLAWSLAGDSGETVADLAIYERVEFVRGATGLLTGAGDPSASINLVRKHADSTALTGYVNVATGSWDKRQLTTDISTGLNDAGTLRGRVVAKYLEADSFVDLYEDQKSVFYAVLESDFDADTTLRLGASYQENDPTAPSWGALPTFFTDGSKTDWDRSTTTSASWTEWQTVGTNAFANLSHTFDSGWLVVASYNFLQYEQNTKLLYLYGTLDKETGEGLSTWPYKSDGESTQDSFDVQVKGLFGAWGREHELVFGALYSEQSADTISYAASGFASTAGNFYQWDGSFAQPQWASQGSVAQDMDTTQKGLYAATRLSVSEALKFIAGGRISSWERSGVSYGTPTNFGDNGVFIPYAGALYDLSAEHRLYASYTEIFMPQNAQDRYGDYLDPLEGRSYEIGVKSAFFADRLHASLALFRIEQDNLAQDDEGFIVPGSSNTQASYAAQGTTSKGFEIEVVGQPIDGWNINLGYSQFQAHEADGNDVNTDHPRKQLKLFTTYQLLTLMPSLTVGGGINWQDETYANVTNPVTGQADNLTQDAYTLASLMARYDITEQLDVQLNVDNLFDKKYYSQVGFFSQYRYGEPRSFSLGLNYRF